MKCELCHHNVYGNEGITVIGVGAAHILCFEREKQIRRIFEGVNISRLDDQALTDLYDMVLAEKNSRLDNFEDDAIELF